jgi:chaperonin GroES
MSELNYKPLSDRIIVKVQEAEQKTASGIVLPDTAQEKPQSATVIKVGPGRITDDGKTIPMTVKEGDVVIYARYGGTEFKVGSTDYLIIRESDILAVKN